MSFSAAWQRALLLLTAAAGAALMFWTAAGGWKLPPVGGPQREYYNLLVDGFRKGTLALDLEVPEELKKMANPWDASKRPPDLAPHDVSYYRGHYYLYFGVVPAVLLFWPFRALTGCDLPLVWSAIFFGVGAYLASAWLWLRVVRDQFPRAGLVTKLAGVAALGLVGGQLALERRVAIWEIPIEAGHFFMLGLLASAYLAIRSSRPWPWLAAAGAALGLAVGCRPTLIVAGPALAFLTIVVGGRGWAAGGNATRARRLGAAILAAGIPFAIILAGLLAYNYARFGSPFEFGTTYQLSGGYDYRDKHFSFSFLPYNLRVYFWSAPQWGRYFPFLHPIRPIRQPAGYYGIEYVYGALVICPVLWWSALFPLGWAGRRERPALAALLGFLALLAAGTTLFLLSFNVAAARYVADFLPWWVWLALIGWACLEDRLTGGKRAAFVLRWALRCVFGACAAASCVLALCDSVEVHEMLRASDPAAYAHLARFFDAPVAWWERAVGYRGGALEMTVTFPEKNSGSVEPLLVTGVAYQKDYVYIFYTDSHRLRLGYRSMEHPPIESELLSVVPGRPYRLRVECGALFPPNGHPAYDGWTAPEIRALTHWTKITLDGKTVLNQAAPANEASPGSVRIGWDEAPALYGPRFAGTIRDVVRTGVHRPQLAAPKTGDVWLDLTFPAQGPSRLQPLLVAGKPGDSEAVGFRMVDADHFVLAEEIWHAGLSESGLLTVPEGREAKLRVRMGPALGLDERSPVALLAHSVVVWIEETPVWWRSTPAVLPPHPEIAVGENRVGSSALAPTVEGRLNSMERAAPQPAWRGGPTGAIEMVLGGRGAGAEPLVSSGAPGRDDLLEIEWLPGGQARLVYSHARKIWISSPTFAWNPQQVHHIRIATPGLATLDAAGAGAEHDGILRIELDGSKLWSPAVPYYPGARSESVVLGGYGGVIRTTSAVLTCAVLDIRQDSMPAAAP